MQIYKHDTDISILYNINSIFSNGNICFFDIETTGLSRQKNIIYLIGVVYMENNTYKTIQWFNDDGNSEKLIICEFIDFIKDYNIIVNYNGTSFDIPFVYERATRYNINFDIYSFESYDLYKIVSKHKKFLSLNNVKQKTVELFLHINRTDKYDGGTLINIYSDYLHNKDNESCNLLLLHNFDDICGLVEITDILSYTDMANGDFDVTEINNSDTNVIISCKLYNPLKNPFSLMGEYFYISGDGYSLRFLIKTYNLTLKFFYDNYKNYYYLPDEDMAIHKSVAQFVDNAHKVKASKENCYVKKEDVFLIQSENIFQQNFKEEYSDKFSYIPVSDFVNEQNPEIIKKYTLSIIKEAAH